MNSLNKMDAPLQDQSVASDTFYLYYEHDNHISIKDLFVYLYRKVLTFNFYQKQIYQNF